MGLDRLGDDHAARPHSIRVWASKMRRKYEVPAQGAELSLLTQTIQCALTNSISIHLNSIQFHMKIKILTI